MTALFSYLRATRLLIYQYRWLDPDIKPDPDNEIIAPSIIYLFKHCLELIGKILITTPKGNKHSLQSFSKHILDNHAEVVFQGDDITFEFSDSEQSKLKEYCRELLWDAGYNEWSVAWLEMMIYMEDEAFKINLRHLFEILRKYDFWDINNSYFRYLDIKIEKPTGDFWSYREVIEGMYLDLPFLDKCKGLVVFLFLSSVK